MLDVHHRKEIVGCNLVSINCSTDAYCALLWTQGKTLEEQRHNYDR